MLVLPLGANATVVEGSLDTTFNGTGAVVTAMSTGVNRATAVALQPDGKIVAVGWASNGSNNDFALARYNPNGSLDTTFNGTGKVMTPMGSGNDFATGLAIQPDGKIVAAGYSSNGSNDDFAVARYNPDGSLDTTFNGTGKITTPIGSSNDDANAVALQPDGKIVVTGLSSNGSNLDFALARYNPNGSLDTTFNSTGKVTTPIGSGDDVANAVTIQPDGEIVAAGYSSNGSNLDFALARYNPSGSLDTTFNSTGTVTTPIGSGNDAANAVTLQPDGKIVATGYTSAGSDSFALVRYNPNGSLDTTFNATGKVTTSFHSGGRALAVAMQPNGKIVAGGNFSVAGPFEFALVRYNPDGSLDTTFNGSGIVTTAIRSTDDSIAALAIQTDGKIVAAGTSANAGNSDDWALARYIGDATPPYPGRMIGVPRYSTLRTRTFDWTASDDNTGISTFDVVDRFAAYSASSYGSWHTLISATPYAHGSFTGSAGYTYCFEVRGRDYAGNVGAYSSPSCVAFPVDDRTLALHGTWSNATSSHYYQGTYRYSTVSGAYLTLPVVYQHLALVVTTCPTCGTLKVYLGSTLIKTVSTLTNRTHYQVVIEVASVFPQTSGTIKLLQSSSGKPVYVDGVAVSLN